MLWDNLTKAEQVITVAQSLCKMEQHEEFCVRRFPLNELFGTKVIQWAREWQAISLHMVKYGGQTKFKPGQIAS